MSSLFRIINFLILFVLLGYQSSNGQYYQYRDLNTTNGLIQSQINVITEDQDRNLWFGTLAGLTRYNGKDFRSYTSMDGLAEDWVTSAACDKNGQIWAGHWDGGLSFYDKENDRFRELNLPQDLNKSSIIKLICPADSMLWALLKGGELLCINPVNLKIKRYGQEKDFVSAGELVQVEFDGKDLIVLVFEQKIILYNLNTKKIIRIPETSFSSEKWHSACFTGQSLFLLNESGLIKEIKLNTASEPSESVHQKITLPEEFFSSSASLLSPGGNEIWIRTEDHGTAMIYKNNHFLKLPEIHNFNSGLSSNRINTLFLDKSGITWIGTSAGANGWIGEGFYTINEYFGLSDNLVWDLTEYNGIIYAATENGISLINPAERKILKSVLKGKKWLALQKFRKNLYALAESGEVFDLSASTPLKVADLQKKSLCLSASEQSGLLVGTREGLFALNPFSKSEKLISHEIVYRLFSDSKSVVWGASMQSGLFMLNQQKLIPKGGSLLQQKFILDITENEKGHIWISTYNAGLFQFNGNQFTQHELKGPQFNYTPYSICFSNGKCWVGTNRGLGLYNPDSETFFHLNGDQGYGGIENNPGAIVITGGEVFAGSIMGVVRLNQSFIGSRDRITAPVSLSRLQVNLRDQLLQPEGDYPYELNNFTFQVNCNEVLWVNKALIEYRLIGNDTSWKSLSGNTISFTSLLPGKYQFQCRVSLPAHAWSGPFTLHTFNIQTPFWKTWWFMATAFLLTATTLASLIRNRNRNLLNDKIELESKVMYLEEELKEQKAEEVKQRKQEQISGRLIGKIKENHSFPLPAVPVSFIQENPNTGHFYFATTIDKTSFVCMIEIPLDGTAAMLAGCFLEESLRKEFILKDFVNAEVFMDRMLTAVNRGGEESLFRNYIFLSCHQESQEMHFCGKGMPLLLFRNEQWQELSVSPERAGVLNLKPKDYIISFTHSLASRRGGQTGSEAGISKVRSIIQPGLRLKDKQYEVQIMEEIKNWSAAFPGQAEYLIGILQIPEA